MITRNFEITLRIPEQGYIPMCFDVVQNDKDVYSLTVHITDGLDEIEYTQISSATVTFAKADGKVVQGDMTVGTDSLTYTMGTNEISYPGQVLASIQLFGASGERLTTARFRFNVVADLITPSAVKSTSEFPILQRLKEELEAIDVVDLTNQFNAHLADYASLIDNPTMHRNIFRGKNLGTSLTTEQKTKIQNGTFKDLFLGDYWVIGGQTWRIVDFDYWYNCGDTAFTNHHLVIMPDSVLYSHVMNETNTTTGGYVGSLMYTSGLNQAKTLVASVFGDMVLTHREYLVNAVTDGKPSAGAWFDSSVELPNEIMIYGSYVFTPAADGQFITDRYTIGNSQLALMQQVPRFIKTKQTYWLRDVVSATSFARVFGNGLTNYSGASASLGVRPVFPIG